MKYLENNYIVSFQPSYVNKNHMSGRVLCNRMYNTTAKPFFIKKYSQHPERFHHLLFPYAFAKKINAAKEMKWD